MKKMGERILFSISSSYWNIVKRYDREIDNPYETVQVQILEHEKLNKHKYKNTKQIYISVIRNKR